MIKLKIVFIPFMIICTVILQLWCMFLINDMLNKQLKTQIDVMELKVAECRIVKDMVLCTAANKIMGTT